MPLQEFFFGTTGTFVADHSWSTCLSPQTTHFVPGRKSPSLPKARLFRLAKPIGVSIVSLPKNLKNVKNELAECVEAKDRRIVSECLNTSDLHPMPLRLTTTNSPSKLAPCPVTYRPSVAIWITGIVPLFFILGCSQEFPFLTQKENEEANSILASGHSVRFTNRTTAPHHSDNPSLSDNPSDDYNEAVTFGSNRPAMQSDMQSNYEPHTTERNRVPLGSAASSGLDARDLRPPLLLIETQDTTFAGVPIGLFADQTFIMKSDGKIQFLENASIRHQRIVSERFQPIQASDLALELHAEFGRQYSVKQDPPYLIVAHPGRAAAWSKRFRNIVHSFRIYCSTHGIKIRPIEFPLTAVVFGTQREFLRYANLESAKLPPNCVGYYSQKSNRIVMFESPTGKNTDGNNGNNTETIATICHEATHQLAFNTGLHQRLSATPLWLAEGFATMFESPLLAGLNTKEGSSRWPESRRQDWRDLAKKPNTLANLIDSLIREDTKFESNPMDAYCASWAMVAYLSQRRSNEFSQFVERMASMPPYQDYSALARIQDFREVFGGDSRIMTKNLIQYIESLP